MLELTIENGAIKKITDRSVEAADHRLKKGPSPLETEIAAQGAVLDTPKAYWRRLIDWVNASSDSELQRELDRVRKLCRRKSYCPSGTEALKIAELKKRAEAAGFSAKKSRASRKAVENSPEIISTEQNTEREINMQNDSQNHWRNFDFSTCEAIEKQGFVGKVRIDDWKKDGDPRPTNAKGVYLVVWNKQPPVHFVEPGTGGRYKNRDPNEKTEILEKYWIPETCILYIGKAGGSKFKTGLRDRLNAYMRFGSGKLAPHWGGRYIWQIHEHGELLVYWKELPNEEPRCVEKLLLKKFKEQYDGRLPFANIIG